MWRLIVAAVHADHHIAEEETKLINEYLENLKLNQEEKDQLKKELYTPASLDEILPKITHPGHRSQAIYFTRLLLWKDNVLSDEEKLFLKKIKGKFSDFSDIKKIEINLKKIQEKTLSEPDMIFPDTFLVGLAKKMKNFGLSLFKKT